MGPFLNVLDTQVTLNSDGTNISDAAQIPVARFVAAFVVDLSTKFSARAA